MFRENQQYNLEHLNQLHHTAWQLAMVSARCPDCCYSRQFTSIHAKTDHPSPKCHSLAGNMVNISNAAVRSQKSSHTNQTKSLANTNQIYHTNQTVATRSPCEHFSCSRRFLKSLHIQIKFSQLQSWKKSQDDKRS